MNYSSEADELLGQWMDGNRDFVISSLDEYEASVGRAVLAQLMLRIMDEDNDGLPDLVELLEHAADTQEE